MPENLSAMKAACLLAGRFFSFFGAPLPKYRKSNTMES